MIKVKSLLFERKFDLSVKEDAAEYLIRAAWKFIPSVEDRYNSEDVFLWIDNDLELHKLAVDLAFKFYPNEDEPWYAFQSDLASVLPKLDADRLERKKLRNPSTKDPLYILKRMMVNASWNQAKYRIAKMSLWNLESRKVGDDDAEESFERLYRNAMGETWYDVESTQGHNYGRLNALKLSSEDGSHQYVVNSFIRAYGNKNGEMGEQVRVWRGTNNPHSKIRPGDYVTLDRGYSQNYMRGKYKSIITGILFTKDLILIIADQHRTELMYWPEGHQIQRYAGEVPTLRNFWEQNRFGI